MVADIHMDKRNFNIDALQILVTFVPKTFYDIGSVNIDRPYFMLYVYYIYSYLLILLIL